tara:strand:- start:16619 stop:17164 length:546 start_codon:yes stop_codon:yes gene_type:complete
MAKGGDSTTTATSGIANEFLPLVKKVLTNVTDKYESDVEAGADNVIAGLTEEQKLGLGSQKLAAADMIAGQGAWDLSGNLRRDLDNTLGTAAGAASMGGALGSARSQAATQKALGDVSAGYQGQMQKDILKGGELMGKVGATMQQQQQKRLDAPDLMASRYFGYLTGAPQQKVQTTTGGGK